MIQICLVMGALAPAFLYFTRTRPRRPPQFLSYSTMLYRRDNHVFIRLRSEFMIRHLGSGLA
jgi:hypothetical protein